MKKIVFNLRSFFLLAALVLAGSTVCTQAQFPLGSYTNNFATGGSAVPFSGSGSVKSWIGWYSLWNNTPFTNDVTTPDTLAGAGAGSLEVNSPFTAAGSQNLFFGTFGNGGTYDFSVTANLLNFDTVSFDVYVNPTNQVSPPDANGNWGTINVGVINTSYGYEGFGAGSVTIPGAASNGWVHLSVPIDHTIANVSSIPGICFDYNSYGGYPKTNLTFWIGNLVVHYTGAPPPPPTNYLNKIQALGLVQFADATPSYNRQDIRTDQSGTANVTWYNQPGPVKYSWTIASFPSATYSNFLSGFTLTPDAVASENYSDPDWSASNVVWVAIQNNSDGTATAGIAWKTNEPAGNSQLYNPTNGVGGQLIPYNSETNGFTVPSIIGTWSVTFNNNTNITLTGPNGSSTNVVLDPTVAALFNGYVGAYLYSSPTVNANVGQYCTYSAYNITGVGTPVNENLTSGALISPFLVLNSQNYFYAGDYTNSPPNQVFATASAAYWLAWSLPAAGFSPVVSASLTARVWNNVAGSIFVNGAQNWIQVSKASLPAPNQGYFAMIQRTFTQLQVLLPGETNAPGTLTGKIGTPTPVSLSGDSGYENITVNAVDSTFHIVSGVIDTIQITSTTDGTATTPLNTAMVNGTVNFINPSTIQFDTAGPQTVTATDMTTLTIPAVTSSTVTVGP
jgi:hypothetical protein